MTASTFNQGRPSQVSFKTTLCPLKVATQPILPEAFSGLHEWISPCNSNDRRRLTL